MTEATISPPAHRQDWAHLIQAEQVHGSIYTDPAIYQEELRKIWQRTWVYVGHESEIPNPTTSS
jgi:hypothetical protein